MKFDKHFFNALMYDICNWSLNFMTVALLWSLNHFYCVAMVGLFVLRFLADYLYRKSLGEEMAKQMLEARKELNESYNNLANLTTQVEPTTEFTPEELEALEEFRLEDLEFPSEDKPVNKDDKKVH